MFSSHSYSEVYIEVTASTQIYVIQGEETNNAAIHDAAEERERASWMRGSGK